MTDAITRKVVANEADLNRAVGGPAGGIIGLAVGAVAGGLAGKSAAEAVSKEKA